MNAPLPAGFAGPLEESITLRQAKKLIQCMAHEQSFLLLAPPGVGKSEMVYQAAREAGLPCRSLLGTQIAPEDVSGVPRIVGERSVFCPPRLLLPEQPEPFCLFLDELPACAPDVQKAFYSLLLERRLGEHTPARGHLGGRRRQPHPGPRARAVDELGARQPRDDPPPARRRRRMAGLGAARTGVRPEIRSFISYMPDALMRAVPHEPVPFSTPRSWTLLSRALDMAEAGGILTRETRRALAFGRLSAEDAAVFCALAEEAIGAMHPLEHYVEHPERAAARRHRALVRPELHPPARARRQARGAQAAHGQPLPAEPPARAPAHAPHRPRRPLGRARRGRRDARPPEAGREAVNPDGDRARRCSSASSAACGW